MIAKLLIYTAFFFATVIPFNQVSLETEQAFEKVFVDSESFADEEPCQAGDALNESPAVVAGASGAVDNFDPLKTVKEKLGQKKVAAVGGAVVAAVFGVLGLVKLFYPGKKPTMPNNLAKSEPQGVPIVPKSPTQTIAASFTEQPQPVPAFTTFATCSNSDYANASLKLSDPIITTSVRIYSPVVTTVLGPLTSVQQSQPQENPAQRIVADEATINYHKKTFVRMIQDIRRESCRNIAPKDLAADEATALMGFMNDPKSLNRFLHADTEKDKCLCHGGVQVFDPFCLLAKYVKKAQSKLEKNSLNVEVWINYLLVALYETCILFNQSLFETRYPLRFNLTPYLAQSKMALEALHDFFEILLDSVNSGLLPKDEDIKLLAKYCYGHILSRYIDLCTQKTMNVECKAFEYQPCTWSSLEQKVFLVVKMPYCELNALKIVEYLGKPTAKSWLAQVSLYAEQVGLLVENSGLQTYFTLDGKQIISDEVNVGDFCYLAIEVKGLKKD